MIDYWIDTINKSEAFKGKAMEHMYIVTNEMFHGQFMEWAKAAGFDPSHIVNDGTTSNDSRLGACADIELFIRECKVLIIS